ncbi:MAG: hypothetical protein QOE99_1122, partial [Actinomycetota bacterium]|nr:hypothetical protein [Actinomycetota bacterium]
MCSNGSQVGEVDALSRIDVSGLPISGLQGLIALGTAQAARLGGIASRALGELQVRGGGQVPDRDGQTCPTPAWLRQVADVTGNEAGRQLRTSVALRELPLVSEAVVEGLISPEHGRILTGLVGKIDAQALSDSQPALIEVATRTDPSQLASYVRHLLATWCEPDLEAEEAGAEDRRFLTLVDKHNGSWRLTGELPDAAIEILRTVLEPLARRDGTDDRRTAGQRRADALSDVFGLALRYADLPDAGGHRPLLTYLLPLSLADAATDRIGRPDQPHPTDDFTVHLDRHPGADCPTAAWTGPATRAQIDRLLCDARIQRLVLDSDGQIVTLTSLTDTITKAQRRAVAARDRCCTAKGCTKPPAFCDVHHLIALADGGVTEIGNLVLLCRRHHVMWHR